MENLRPRATRLIIGIALAVGSVVGCTGRTQEVSANGQTAHSTGANVEPRSGCDSGNGGIDLPSGFCASVFADKLGHARHLVVAPSGVVYVNTWSGQSTKLENAPGGYIVALRDDDRDGHADTIQRFGKTNQNGKPGGGTGIALRGDALYVEVDGKIVRFRLTPGSLVPMNDPDVIVSGMPTDGDHPMHPFAIAPSGTLFVNSGSATNSCQQKNRTLESPGRKPCGELSTRGGIWIYDANKTDQIFSPAARYATGARNSVALAVYPRDGSLYAAIHGRDQLGDNWPKLYTEAQNNELPAEVFVRVAEGDDFGWPYCYYDAMQAKYVMAPEYGGDGGKAVGACSTKKKPDVTFPAHVAPDSLAFYSGSSFPAKYHDGAFVALHGSWNRKPTQAGYLVAFVPFVDGKPSGRYEDFATGFAGAQPPAEPTQAAYRPMGIAVGPAGELYISDDTKGRIWRITHTGGTS